jgi:hypothetical protein
MPISTQDCRSEWSPGGGRAGMAAEIGERDCPTSTSFAIQGEPEVWSWLPRLIRPAQELPTRHSQSWPPTNRHAGTAPPPRRTRQPGGLTPSAGCPAIRIKGLHHPLPRRRSWTDGTATSPTHRMDWSPAKSPQAANCSLDCVYRLTLSDNWELPGRTVPASNFPMRQFGIG